MTRRTGRPRTGRPSRYRPEYNELAKNFALMGATDKELAALFGVSFQTLNSWKRRHPEFLESLKGGKDAADARVARALYTRATGYDQPVEKIFQGKNGEIVHATTFTHIPADVGAAKLWLCNRQPKKWRERIEFKEDIDLNVFPSRDVLDAIFRESLARSGEKATLLANRRERLGIVQSGGDGE